MSRRKRTEEEYVDPIREAHRKAAYEHYKNTLFLPIMDYDELMEIRWLVDGLLPIGYLVLLAGCPKAGKTSLATAIALAVANGVPFAGRPTTQSSVLWMAAEENRYERRLLLGSSPLAETSTPLYTCYERLSIEDEETINILVDWINKTGAQLIVVDPLLGATGGHSLRDSWCARRSLQMLKDLCNLASVTAIVLHHRKRDYLRAKSTVADNAQLAATASMSIVLTSTPALAVPNPAAEASERRKSKPIENDEGQRARGAGSESQPRIVRLACEGRGAWANRTQIFYSEGPLDYQPIHDEPLALRAEMPPTGAERWVIQALSDDVPRTAEEISKIINKSGKSVRNLVTNLRRKGFLRVIPGSKWPYRYALIRANQEYA